MWIASIGFGAKARIQKSLVQRDHGCYEEIYCSTMTIIHLDHRNASYMPSTNNSLAGDGEDFCVVSPPSNGISQRREPDSKAC